MPEKVLIYSRFPKALMVRIGQRFELMDAAGKPPAEVFAAEQLSDIRALITAGGQPLGAAVLDTLPSLRAIVCYGTGYDGVDLAAAASRKIAVGNSPAANAAAVADLAVTLMLAVTRRLLPADEFVRDGSWAASKPSPLLRPQPGNPGRRVGVYGMGEIGRKIAARVAAFEAEVGYFSRSRHDVPYQYFPSLEALADWCSVLMIAVRAGADTHHAVNAGILQKTRQGRLCRQHLARLGDRPVGVGRSVIGQYDRRRRSRRVRERAARAGRIDSVCQRRADPACRRPHHRVAYCNAGLRDRQSRGVFRREAACLSRALTNAVYGKKPGNLTGLNCRKLALGKPGKTR
jgi:hydroxypyruvate reductase